jgi:hypothetical protein
MPEEVILQDAMALLGSIPTIETAIGNMKTMLSGGNLATLNAAILAQKAKAVADVSQTIADLQAAAAAATAATSAAAATV